MNEKMNEVMAQMIGERMMNKYRLFKIYESEFQDNRRQCPFYSEMRGMEETLKIMGIDYEYTFNDMYEITGITIEGITVIA